MRKSSIGLWIAVFFLAGGLFLLDLQVPLGVAVWLPYVAVVLISLWFFERWQTYFTAGFCTALMVLGLFWSPPGNSPFWTAAVNRLLGIFALWMAAIVGLAARRTLQLQEANRKLQQEILERERLQAQLLRTQRLESIGILASGIAHDFNNLLTPILMAAKILREDRPESERMHLLGTLQASAERGAEMVGQLLSFAGGTESQRTIVGLKQLLKEVKSIVEHTFPKNIAIQVDVDRDLRPVLGDVTQLSQVLMNLCVNARDAMPAGGTLTIATKNAVLDADQVRIHPEAKERPYVVISVADSGCGIAPEILDQVFDPFFTTKVPGKGTGLGLSTVLGIVKSHGGFIDVASVLGRGSRFTVHLPAQLTASTEEIPLESTRIREGNGELILVVDDETLILETVRTTLESHGYQLLTAVDGGEAVTVFKDRQSDIRAVILDMMMPGMDGAATMEALQEMDPKVRIIASSGLRLQGRVAESVAAGETVYLRKPYTAEQILAAVACTLQPKR